MKYLFPRVAFVILITIYYYYYYHCLLLYRCRNTSGSQALLWQQLESSLTPACGILAIKKASRGDHFPQLHLFVPEETAALCCSFVLAAIP